MSNKILVLNPKEYSTVEYLASMIEMLSGRSDIIFCPPIQQLYNPDLCNLNLGCQIIDFDNGTGKVRGKYLNVKYSLCGHFDHKLDTKLQVKECLENDIIPIVFVDNEDELFLINSEHIWVYEPHSKIGKAESENVDSIGDFVKLVKSKYGENTKILYGGSVNINNAPNILKVADGLCIGRMSRDLHQLKQLLSLLD